jgi:hypothetical protein
MKYFLPDSQDLVDPSFDFETERRSVTRMRQRDDQYAHEIFRQRMLDGILISKGIVDGFGGAGSRYTIAQRQRLLRVGAREFFRLEKTSWSPIALMGDCGAFTYVREPQPPYSIEDVSTFYVDCGFDYGISVDHVILEYNAKWDAAPKDVPDEVAGRQALTLDLARKFFQFHKRQRLPFELLGVAQGWSPKSYERSVRELQKIGFRHIAIGGMVPLKTPEILASLRAIGKTRRPDTQLHLLGITRTEALPEFAAFGVTSFDSTSPLRQAFKDAKDNYYSMDAEFTAIRIPQVEGNPTLQKMISSGQTKQEHARRLEGAALLAMKRFDANEVKVPTVLDALEAYEACYAPDGGSHREQYATTLDARPWRSCECDVCATLGHHVILFRGAERNRRRGLHNTWTFYRRVQRQTAHVSVSVNKSRHALKAAAGETRP